MNKLSHKSIFIIALAAIILLGALIAHFTALKNPAPATQKFAIPERNDYFFGTSTPKVTIDEFSDFACSHCLASYAAVREIGYKYKDSVKIIFKDFPSGDDSLALAMAGRCAGEQGFFWPMHDKLFSRQGQFATTSLPDLAVSVGADKNIFTACLASQKYLTDIRADYADGQSLGVSGTPTFFINGYRFSGTITESQFEEIIQQFLK
jgi:protein-disulfide isomerase